MSDNEKMYGCSFLIVALNEENFIGRCILSIKSEAERAKLKDYEIIVCDNGSTDNTVKISEELGCKVVHCPEKGITRARQKAHENAKYNIQAFLDADNFIPHFWLDNFKALDDEKVCAISGPVKYYDGIWYVKKIDGVFYFLTRLFHHFFPVLQGGNFVLKGDKLDQAGGIPVKIDFYAEDQELGRRMSKVGTIKLLPKMWIHSSARRLNAEGSVRVVFTYMINYFYVNIRGKPFTTTYKDHRE